MANFKTAYSAKNQAGADSLSRNRELWVCQQQGATILFVRAKQAQVLESSNKESTQLFWSCRNYAKCELKHALLRQD